MKTYFQSLGAMVDLGIIQTISSLGQHSGMSSLTSYLSLVLLANCELDADKILLDISNVTILQKRRNERSEDRFSTEPVTVAMPAPSMPKKYIAAYMVGYLIKKYPKNSCTTSFQMFQVQTLPETSNVSYYELLRFKTFKGTNCLVYPSATFAKFVQTS